MCVLTDSRGSAALISAVVLSLQLLAAENLAQAQSTNSPLPCVSQWDMSSTNKAVSGQGFLSQLQKPVSSATGRTETTVPLASDLGQLEWTGQYVERWVRVPAGNAGQVKLIKFLIPVYREKGTQRKASVGTEDKKKNLMTVQRLPDP